MRLIGLFPGRSEIDPVILKLANPKTDYPAIRDAAWRLLKAGHVLDVLAASYARLIVDEYQDCSIPQHAIVYYAAPTLPTCVLGDPMQAIFGWPGNELADWDKHVCQHFPLAGELTTPWRWKNAGTESFGRWLLDVRRKLKDGTSVDLTSAPPEVTWVHLDRTEDRIRQLRAASIRAPTPDGTVLIIGKSTSPSSQQEFASQTPGAVTVEAVDLKDLVQFARDLDFQGVDALERVASFAGSVMTNVGGPDLIRRVGILERGKERREPSDAERAALRFKAAPTPAAAVDLLVEISKDAGVRTHRPSVLRASIKALRSCDGSEGNTFLDAAIRAREQNRLLGRPLPKRAVGSTLLLKGLEADISVILDAGDLDARNLYVAMTRGSRGLVVCSNTAVLTRQTPSTDK
jgi:DNA helicase-2/ATP-dependent DNA helicase PcrA